LNAVAADTPDSPLDPVHVRVVLVQDTQPNGAQALGSSVFTDIGNSGQVNFSFLAMGAGGNGRFRILKDKTYVIQPAVITVLPNTNYATSFTGTKFSLGYKFNKPLAVRIATNSSTPTVASLTDNNIFMLAHASAALPEVSLTSAARAYYMD